MIKSKKRYEHYFLHGVALLTIILLLSLLPSLSPKQDPQTAPSEPKLKVESLQQIISEKRGNAKTNSQSDNLDQIDKTKYLKGVNLNDPLTREKIVGLTREAEIKEQKALTNQLSSYKETPESKGNFGQWGQWQLLSIDPQTGRKRALITHDVNATIAANATNLAASYLATGLGVRVGVWDAGVARTNHQEYVPRVTLKDSGALAGHATHVTGIIAAKGVRTNAKSISFESSVDTYDWNQEFSELVERAAASENDTNKIGVSNHSYGYVAGWNKSGTNFVFWGDYNFGIYGIAAKESDSISYAAPYYLMVRSAGNDRVDNPAPGSSIKLDDWSPSEPYNPLIHPPGDGARKGGYDTLSEGATGKNILSVGAVENAVTSGQRDLSKAVMTYFSSWGPTDDGRIKPDIVASGVAIYTTTSTSSTAYNTGFSGTSASAPIVASVIASLTHRYRMLTGKTHMLSSTMKALIICGADDLGTKGPDYQFGHGHVNALKSLQILENWSLNPENLNISETILNVSDSITGKKYRKNLQSPQNGGKIRIVLCWTDPAGDYNFNTDDPKPTLVNNLEVRLIDPQGNIHFPYAMPYSKTYKEADLSLPAIKAENSVDNVEVIEIDTPSHGNYIIEVFSKGSLQESQKFSLVIEGLNLNKDNPDPDANPYAQWAQNYFGPTWAITENTSPEGDYDSDNVSNGNEFLLGTNPLDRDSKIKAEISKIQTNGPNKKLVTIKVSPVVSQEIGLTKLISTDNMFASPWNGPTTIVVPNDNAQNTNNLEVETTIEVEGDQFFFKAQFEPTSPISL
jgi:hypothetical protein